MNTNYGIFDIDLQVSFVFRSIMGTTPTKLFLGLFQFHVVARIQA